MHKHTNRIVCDGTFVEWLCIAGQKEWMCTDNRSHMKMKTIAHVNQSQIISTSLHSHTHTRTQRETHALRGNGCNQPNVAIVCSRFNVPRIHAILAAALQILSFVFRFAFFLSCVRSCSQREIQILTTLRLDVFLFFIRLKSRKQMRT